jgi:lipopolysaccharide transport system permease protein
VLKRLWEHRALAVSLVQRQYQLRYRQSVAGIWWAVFPTLASLLVATIVFHKVIGVNTGGVPYPLFTLAALTPWAFFATALTTGVPSIVVAQTMVSRLAFPRAVLPISVVGTALIDLGISVLVFVAYALITRVGLPLTTVWIGPLVVLEIVLVTGIVLLGSALNTFARDIRLAVPLIAQLWLYLTPVMYPLRVVPKGLRALYLANPMTGVVESFRAALVYGHGPNLHVLWPALVGAVALLAVGTWYFSATESRFADVV